MICEKCGGVEFDEFEAFNAKFAMCLKCKKLYQLTESEEWNQYKEEKRQEDYEKRFGPTITCPYCQSTKTKKISTTSRVVSTGLFGLASKKVGKQWHCNKCGSDF